MKNLSGENNFHATVETIWHWKKLDTLRVQIILN